MNGWLTTKVNSLNLEKIILFFLCLYVPFDMLNGLLTQNNYANFFLIPKALPLVLIIIYLFNKKTVLDLSVALIISIFYLANQILLFNMDSIYTNLDWLIKFLSIVIFYLFFSCLVKKGLSHYIFIFFTYSFIFLLINSSLSLFSIGNSMYTSEGEGDGIGSKGLIFAGNEISALLVIVTSGIQINCLNKKKYKLFFFFSFLGMLIALSILSKVATGGIAIVSILLLISQFKKCINKNRIKKKDLFILVFFIFLFFILIGVGFTYVALYSNLPQRLSYFYDRVDLLTLIFSHRNIWAIDALNIFTHKYSIYQVLFGDGKNWYVFISNDKMVEIDLIDFLMTYGICGVLIVYGFLMYLLLKLFKNKYNPYRVYLIIAILLIIAISLTSGHILNSGIAGAQLAALLSLINCKGQ